MQKTAVLLTWLLFFSNASAQEAHRKEKSCRDSCKLNAELEIYPINAVNPTDPVIKNEAMFDYHDFYKGDHLFNVRFFGDANTHWDKERDMEDLIMYSEIVYGFKYVQFGFETGTVTGKEYIGLGINLTAYDTKIFKRASLVTRIFPDYVVGYEYTTKELKIFHNVFLSSTGTSRIILPNMEMVIQASAWISFEKFPNFYIGMEYEYNNANFYHTIRRETPHELFGGIKIEFQ